MKTFAQTAGKAWLGLALLLTLSILALQAAVDYPEIFVESPANAFPLLLRQELIGLLAFWGLAASGILLASLSMRLEAGQRVVWLARFVAVAWSLAALAGLVLILAQNLGGRFQAGLARGYPWIGLALLLLSGSGAAFLLAIWTVTLVQRLRIHTILGWVGAAGLFLWGVCALGWALNALLPVDAGFYGTTGLLSLLSALGLPIWLFWLLLSAPRLESGAAASRPEKRSVLRSVGVRLAGVVLGVLFVLVAFGLRVLGAPAFSGGALPAEPSLTGTLLYQAIYVYAGLLHPMHTVSQFLDQPYQSAAARNLPAGVSITAVNASGVPAQMICAPGATKQHFLIYLHGGGFVAPANDQHLLFVSLYSKATGMCVLLPAYRLAPQNPFPAGLQDCVTAYRWLLAQGVPADHIAIAGESAGANLVLATALALRDQGVKLPAAMVAISAPFDLTMASPSYQTKAALDPILGAGLPADAYRVYASQGKVDPHNPLLSPFFADLRGLPPTLLQVGTQEVLLDDSIRMAAHMRSAGDQVDLEVWPGMWHAFTLVAGFVPDVKLGTEHIETFITSHMEK